MPSPTPTLPLPRAGWLAFARSRAPILGIGIALGALVSIADDSDAPRDARELAVALGRATGNAFVREEDVRWEPSGGVVSDLVRGRFALFLASATEGGPRDVYRARLRLSPEGRPIGVRGRFGGMSGPRNLTSTPLGDDHALVVRGPRAAFATFAFGQEQSVTALDLSGEGSQNLTKAAHDRVMAYVTNWQLSGSGEGVGRVDVTLDQPAQRVGLALSEAGGILDIQLADDDRSVVATRRAALDLEKNELVTAVAGMHADAGRHLPKRLVFWAVDTVRAVPWIGPAPIAWLEERTFAVRDAVKQAAFKATAGGEALAREPEQAPPTVLDASQAAADLGHWPPPPMRSMWKTPEPGEGEWEAPKQAWVKRLPEAPSPFYRAFVRPDEERPYAKVLLVAMDMRQLDLQMEAGNEDPKPLTGPPGAGRIPRDPAVYTRIAAAFNGGFKTEHGTYGMMLNRRVLLPPLPGIATVVITRDKRYGLGSWGTNKDVGGIEGVEPSEILSFRQNLDPLVDNDKVNPSGRAQWGYTLPGTTMQTERSGLCVTNAGHLLYAWGDDVSATTLGKAMKMASCVYGMHLDMNPHHTGFLFTNISELKGRNYKSELLSTQMEIDTARYIEYAPKDFFYMTMHDPTPPAIEGERIAWEPDAGVQPAPAWMAGLWRGHASGGIDVLEIEPARASFRVRVGTQEPDAKTGAARAHELGADDAHRVLFALTLGTSDAKRLRGLAADGRIVLPMSGGEHAGVLVATEDGQLSIAPARAFSQVPAHTDAVELPLLLEDAKIVARGRARAALGQSADGRVYVLRTPRDVEAEIFGELLVRAGCKRAVLLDRGAGSRGALFRAGTATPPRSRYEETTIYAMGKPLLPRGFRFEPTHPVEPPKKK
ncbi:MAG: phosphodiester glycosidase family protein [Labilithrix sp.]|nr:phosphodiester glycosidase family protein [Labilithrix sp.]